MDVKVKAAKELHKRRRMKNDHLAFEEQQREVEDEGAGLKMSVVWKRSWIYRS
jgi:hypothetical protein